MHPLSIDVVSVQSQVVYGRVGNNVAIPTLEALGLIVAAVPTVLLSNTPHYPTLHGGPVPVDWFEGYLQDLIARGATRQLRAIMVGYLGSPAQAQALMQWSTQCTQELADLRIVIDPVLGDHDHGLYVDPALVDMHRLHLLPLADGLAPNGFELAQLTGMPVDDLPSVTAAARTLLRGRTKWVVVTSAAPDTWAPGKMQVLLVTPDHAEVITHPRIDIAPKGTGDLFCAALTAYWLRGIALPQAVQQACDRVVQAIRRTQQAQSAELLLP